MFQKFLAVCVLLPAVSMAQPVVIDTKVICNSTKSVLAEIAKSDYKELPLWVGEINKQSGTKLAIVANEKTGTWTLLQYNEDVACLLSIGEGYRFVGKDK